MKTYVADFETTTIEEDCHVWAYAICDIDNIDDVIVGTTIDEFMEWCKNSKGNHKVYFHNLKFDGQFILHWLFNNGFSCVDEEHRADNTFTTLISDKGLYYAIEVIFKIKGKKVNKVTFWDSLKLIPLSVDEIAKSFHLPIQKLNIDYNSHNYLPIGSPLTPEETEYIKHDVQIVATAISYFYSQGLDKMTIGSCALNEYKNTIKKKNFKIWFPQADYHKEAKQSYRGGFTCVNNDIVNKPLDYGIVFDVNSLYPSVMRYEKLPYGTPIFYNGKYEDDDFYPLYIQMIKCEFTLKKHKIPTIQIKHSLFYKGTEYLTSSDGEIVPLCLTNVDLELFLEQYEVTNLEYIAGWKFKACQGLFDTYIDKWSNNKIQAKIDKNYGMYLIAKLFLNSLYGKFGTDITVRSKIPYYDSEEDIVRYYDGEEETREGVYIAMASFITSYARYKTITSSQKIEDNYHLGKSKSRWAYSDTDSIHVWLNGETPEEFIANCGLDIDSTRLGAWKYESKWSPLPNTKNQGAKFLRAKCYIENSTEDVYSDDPEYHLKVTVAGMPSNCHEQVTFSNFKLGATYTGKLQPKIVDGGAILKSIDFTIKQ